MPVGNKLKIKEYCYYVFLLTLGIAKGTDTVIPPVVNLLLTAIGLACGFLSLALIEYEFKEKLIGGVLIIIGLISAASIHKLGVLLAVVVILGAKGISYSRAFKTLLLVQIFALLYNAIPTLINLLAGNAIDGFYQERKILGIFYIGDRFRTGLGFLHPNFLQICICLGSTLILYANYDKLKVRHIVEVFLVNLGFYFLTYSNTGIALNFIYCLFLIISKKYEGLADFLSKYCKYIFLVIAFGSVLLGYLYTSSGITAVISRLLTGRFQWAHQYIEMFPMSFLGQRMTGNETGISLDCGYIYVWLKYGILVFTVYCFGIFKLLSKLSKEKRYAEIAVIMLLQFYFVVENFMMICFKNYSFILLSSLIFCQKECILRKKAE